MMKKLLILCAAVLSFNACVQEVLHENTDEKIKNTLLFEGSFGTDTQTKMSLGENKDGEYSMIWSKGDAIGIFSYSGEDTANKNIMAGLFEHSVGNNKGLFVPVERVYQVPSEIEGGDPVDVVEKLEYPEGSDEQFFVYYPFREGTAIEDKAVTANLDQFQKQAAAGDGEIGINGFSTALATVKAGSGKATFNLEHQMAYIRFKATSSEFTGYQLHAIQLFDKNGEARLSGRFIYDIDRNSLTPAEDKTYPSAKVAVSKHDWNSAPEKNELYLTVFPGDYSSADMYVSVTFMNDRGATYTIPMEFNKTCRFPKATLTTVDLGDITLSDNVFPWYEPYETRGLVDMYAYGSENTYMAEHHIRPADNPDARPKSHVVIDVKARGDFSKVAEPKYYALLVPSEMGCTSIKSNARKLLALYEDGKGLKREAIPSKTVNEDYTIDVWVLDTTAGTGSWGTVAIYDAEYNLIWSYLICTWLQGQPIEDVTYANGIKVMDRWLGQENGNRRCAQLKTFNTAKTDSTRSVSGVLPFFQWGRKDPFAWSNSDGNEGIFRSVIAGDDINIESGIRNPTTHYGYLAGNAVFDTHGDWHNGGVRHDLWGGYNNTERDWCDDEAVGHKTIFDPCPAGYRIPDARVLKWVGEHAEIWETPNSESQQITDAANPGCHINENSPFYKAVSGGTSVLAIKDINGEYDYWSFAGFSKNGDNFNGRTSNNRNKALMTWGNSINNGENTAWGRAVTLEYAYYSTARHFFSRYSSQRAYRYPVRCQKIED